MRLHGLRPCHDLFQFRNRHAAHGLALLSRQAFFRGLVLFDVISLLGDRRISSNFLDGICR